MSVELASDEVKRLRVKVLKVHDLLQGKYGRQGGDGKKSPLDELILTVLSQNTTQAHSKRAFDQLKKKFRDWETLMTASLSEISKSIKDGGLNHTKALRIRRILGRIYRDRKSLSLDFLKEWDSQEAMKYLVSLKGIGSRTASRVLLYSLSKPVMPVDTHVERVSKRLGWVWNHASPDQIQGVLGLVTPRYLVMGLYQQLMKHGRVTCKVKNPHCQACVIRQDCDYYKHRKGIKG